MHERRELERVQTLDETDGATRAMLAGGAMIGLLIGLSAFFLAFAPPV